MESTLLTLVVPPLLHPRLRRKLPSRSSSPALGGNYLLPAVVGSPRTNIADPFMVDTAAFSVLNRKVKNSAIFGIVGSEDR